MACQELDSGLSANGRMRGGMGRGARPAGPMTENSRMATAELCRSFDFTPAPTGFLLTFAGADMASFAGGLLAVF